MNIEPTGFDILSLGKERFSDVKVHIRLMSGGSPELRVTGARVRLLFGEDPSFNDRRQMVEHVLKVVRTHRSLMGERFGRVAFMARPYALRDGSWAWEAQVD